MRFTAALLPALLAAVSIGAARQQPPLPPAPQEQQQPQQTAPEQDVPPPAGSEPAATGQDSPSAPAATGTRPSFADFLEGIRAEARSRGISEPTILAALSGIEEPVPTVIERDRSQAEIVFSLEKYLKQHVTAKVLAHGREGYAAHKALLARVAQAYGVPPGIIVGIWGVESNFGRFSGVRPTIPALATLAWDPRRSAFFRGELFDALTIVDRGDIDLASLRGSWAGAMGQVQFMPSSYLQFATDFDGDGRRDIWASPADVFASIANYLQAHGWQAGEPWGREVRVSGDAEKRITREVARRDGSCIATRDMTVPLPLEKWRRLGVRAAGGGPLPAKGADAALVSGGKRHFLVTANYDALLAYNCAHSYALSVGLIADRVTSAGPKAAGKTRKPATKKHARRR